MFRKIKDADRSQNVQPISVAVTAPSAGLLSVAAVLWYVDAQNLYQVSDEFHAAELFAGNASEAAPSRDKTNRYYLELHLIKREKTTDASARVTVKHGTSVLYNAVETASGNSFLGYFEYRIDVLQ